MLTLWDHMMQVIYVDFKKSDADNVAISLGIYNNVNCFDKHPLYKEMGGLIIQGTEVPYTKTPEELASQYTGNKKGFNPCDSSST